VGGESQGRIYKNSSKGKKILKILRRERRKGASRIEIWKTASLGKRLKRDKGIGAREGSPEKTSIWSLRVARRPAKKKIRGSGEKDSREETTKGGEGEPSILLRQRKGEKDAKKPNRRSLHAGGRQQRNPKYILALSRKGRGRDSTVKRRKGLRKEIPGGGEKKTWKEKEEKKGKSKPWGRRACMPKKKNYQRNGPEKEKRNNKEKKVNLNRNVPGRANGSREWGGRV